MVSFWLVDVTIDNSLAHNDASYCRRSSLSHVWVRANSTVLGINLGFVVSKQIKHYYTRLTFNKAIVNVRITIQTYWQDIHGTTVLLLLQPHPLKDAASAAYDCEMHVWVARTTFKGGFMYGKSLCIPIEVPGLEFRWVEKGNKIQFGGRTPLED